LGWNGPAPPKPTNSKPKNVAKSFERSNSAGIPISSPLCRRKEDHAQHQKGPAGPLALEDLVCGYFFYGRAAAGEGIYAGK